ncbi:hypothetical protein M3J09_013847 [Ascochyta lentis]
MRSEYLSAVCGFGGRNSDRLRVLGSLLAVFLTVLTAARAAGCRAIECSSCLVKLSSCTGLKELP